MILNEILKLVISPDLVTLALNKQEATRVALNWLESAR